MMPKTTQISTEELAEHLTDPAWVVVDCRFKLADPSSGERDYSQAHIPGAVYAHLDRDLSGPVVRGVTGRHPLPRPEAVAAAFSRLGIGAGVQVAAYDAAGGALAAARLWWLLRWLGHEAVAVLDGGWGKWIGESRPTRSGVEVRALAVFVPHERPELVVTTQEVQALAQNPTYRLLDSRTADRFRGENEVIDPVAGHIPGARTASYAGNLNPDGTFRPMDRLRARYERLLGDTPTERVVFYCGSGATAAHSILALQYVGLGEARLYAGSWSEWITDPSRPVARGDDHK